VTGPLAPTSTPPPEPRLTRTKSFLTSSLLELVVIVAVVLGLLFAIQAWIVKPYKIPSASMEPTLEIGQRILVDRIGLDLSSPKIGDVMVFHPPADYAVCADPHQGQSATGRDAGQACDAVGAERSSETFVKRVVGLPGDRLSIVNGHVIRNGRREADGYAVPCGAGNTACNFPAEIVVPPGDYYMMGDNRPDSEDSRFWGPVPKAWLIGYVFFRYWPIDHFGTV
jgi:signal peptidase I